MNDGKTVVAVALVGAGAYYLLLRRGAPFALGTGNRMPSFQATPLSPSPLGPGASSTNPVGAILAGLSGALTRLVFKLPGNATSSPATATGTPGSRTMATIPPRQAPPVQSPPFVAPTTPLFSTPGDFLPQAGDPNFAGAPGFIDAGAWAWTMPPGFDVEPPPPLPSGGDNSAPSGLTVGV